MASAIQKALQDIRYSIRPELLQRAFLDSTRTWSTQPADLDFLIRSNVIDTRVRSDCNLIGGMQVLINLSGYPREVPDERSSLYHVPMEATQGRQIVSPHSVSYGYGYSIAYSNYNPWFDQMMQGGCGNAGILTVANQLYSSMSNMPIVESARVQLIAPNTILIQDQVRIPDRVYLRATLEHDSEMSELQPAAQVNFSRLCVLATQAYIYNKLIIEVNRAQIAGGFEIGEFKNQLDMLSDSDEMYRTFLNETWFKTSRMSDHETHLRHIRNMMGVGW